MLLVPKSLLLQACGDARVQQHRIDGLAQVVLGAHLDALDDTVELVERRRHDHRDLAEVEIVLQLREHLVARRARASRRRAAADRRAAGAAGRAPRGRSRRRRPCALAAPSRARAGVDSPRCRLRAGWCQARGRSSSRGFRTQCTRAPVRAPDTRARPARRAQPFPPPRRSSPAAPAPGRAPRSWSHRRSGRST